METAWRRELDSNFWYGFRLCSKTPCVSDLTGFHYGNEHSGETDWARPCGRAVRFLWRLEGEELAIIGRWGAMAGPV